MRQNTPHPRELKAKAHKLFGKGRQVDGDMLPHSEDRSAEVRAGPTEEPGRGLTAGGQSAARGGPQQSLSTMKCCAPDRKRWSGVTQTGRC